MSYFPHKQNHRAKETMAQTPFQHPEILTKLLDIYNPTEKKTTEFKLLRERKNPKPKLLSKRNYFIKSTCILFQ